MIVSPYRTSVTQQHQDGKSLRDCTPDMTRRSGPGTARKLKRRGKWLTH